MSIFKIFKTFIALSFTVYAQDNCNFPTIEFASTESTHASELSRESLKKLCNSEYSKQLSLKSSMMNRFIVDSNCRIKVSTRAHNEKKLNFNEFGESKIIGAGEIKCTPNGEFILTNKSSKICTRVEVVNIVKNKISDLGFSSKIIERNSAHCPKFVKNPHKNKRVIVIMVDGLRYDYIDKFNLKFLKHLSQSNLYAEFANPPFPSQTTASTYSMMTGMEPYQHGIIASRFYDPKYGFFTHNRGEFYGGIPFWNLTSIHGLFSGVDSLTGSSVLINNRFPTYQNKYDLHKRDSSKLEVLDQWLHRPLSFMAFSLRKVDEAGHRFGPESDEMRQATKETDELIRKMIQKIQNNKSYDNQIIIISDHGMKQKERAKAVDLSKLELKSGKLVNSTVLANYYAADRKEIISRYNHFKKSLSNVEIYLKYEVPEKYHYSYNSRIGDIVLISKPGWYFETGKRSRGNGFHGHLTEDDPDMKGVFIAIGNSFSRKTIPKFDIVSLYRLMADLLNLNLLHDKYPNYDPSILKSLK